MRHILSSEQFSNEELDVIFERAASLEDQTFNNHRELAQRHIGEQLCSFYYENSTRTRLSFENAALKLGMGVNTTASAQDYSSVSKNESFDDTIMTLDAMTYSAIVIRTDQAGMAHKAAAISETPIINAGDGKGEHPTQALLDCYTIKKNFGSLENLHVVMGGDLSNGRTVHSLALLLAKQRGTSFTFVSMPELQIGDDIKVVLDETNVKYEETVDMYEAIREANVVYWTRLQKERLDDPNSIPHGGFVIDQTAMETMPEEAILMHPLPRDSKNYEILPEVDSDPRAKYPTQVYNGVFIRMALLDLILENNPRQSRRRYS